MLSQFSFLSPYHVEAHSQFEGQLHNTVQFLFERIFTLSSVELECSEYLIRWIHMVKTASYRSLWIVSLHKSFRIPMNLVPWGLSGCSLLETCSVTLLIAARRVVYILHSILRSQSLLLCFPADWYWWGHHSAWWLHRRRAENRHVVAPPTVRRCCRGRQPYLHRTARSTQSFATGKPIIHYGALIFRSGTISRDSISRDLIG